MLNLSEIYKRKAGMPIGGDPMPKSLKLAVERFEKKHGPRFNDFSDETGFGKGPQGDGYWLYTLPGFCNAENPGQHCFHEWTVKDLIKALDVAKCDCDECEGEPA